MTEIPRRTFLKKLGVAAAGAAAVAVAAGKRLNPVDVPSSEEAEANWRKLYKVQPGDTISKIAAGVYPDYDNNQPFYDGALRLANRQDRQQNALLYPEEIIYIPDPRIPTLGFAAGEEAVLRGQDGKDWSTVVRIDTKASRVEVIYQGTVFDGALKAGEKITADTERPLIIAAILPGGPDPRVPPRVVFEMPVKSV